MTGESDFGATSCVGPCNGPGSSFSELLKSQGPSRARLEVRAGQAPRARRARRCSRCGTTHGVIVAGDRRATEGFQIAHRSIEKVFAADDMSAVAIAGAAGPAVEMVRLFQTELEHYEKVEGERLSLEGKANKLSSDDPGEPARGDAGAGGRAAVRRLRRAREHGSDLQVRRHRRPLRGGRLPRHGLGR